LWGLKLVNVSNQQKIYYIYSKIISPVTDKQFKTMYYLFLDTVFLILNWQDFLKHNQTFKYKLLLLLFLFVNIKHNKYMASKQNSKIELSFSSTA